MCPHPTFKHLSVVQFSAFLHWLVVTAAAAATAVVALAFSSTVSFSMVVCVCVCVSISLNVRIPCVRECVCVSAQCANYKISIVTIDQWANIPHTIAYMPWRVTKKSRKIWLKKVKYLRAHSIQWPTIINRKVHVCICLFFSLFRLVHSTSFVR